MGIKLGFTDSTVLEFASAELQEQKKTRSPGHENNKDDNLFSQNSSLTQRCSEPTAQVKTFQQKFLIPCCLLFDQLCLIGLTVSDELDCNLKHRNKTTVRIRK